MKKKRKACSREKLKGKYIMCMVIFLLFSAGNITAQQISIIGNATPANDWNTDFNMLETTPGSGIWTLDLFLTDNECKFRQDNDWEINWGGTTFPTGTAEFQSADNITVNVTGYYHISFNVNTMAYSFTSIPSPQIDIGTSYSHSLLDVEGSIRTSISGTQAFVLFTGLNTYEITIPGVPDEMVGETGSLVLATISDGCEGYVVQAKVTSSTTMNVKIENHCGSQQTARLNYIIFKL